MSINFRICTESDLEIVREYVISLYREDLPEREMTREMTAEKFDLTFWEFTNKPDKGRIVVFDRDNLVVGYAIIVFYWSNEYGGDFIEVDELFVRQDDQALTFYQRLGFKNSLNLHSIKLLPH
jgi:hypothetical protein